ncbi:DUF3102 domain-containing protein [Desulfitobacterium sp. AusDCA]|uniref:DUF3102 domain-containing protein n=1 Tax=Desulfitobacterium sp. AusDCA TaxID=3240383 RepID=UPI003DA70775
MNVLMKDRTPLVIAAEINTIRHQTGKILLAGAIEIGRRLKEAKDLLPHGEWGKWLEDSVNYSQSRAEKLMRVFDAYGTQQPASLDTGAQAQALSNLNYSQAFILLGVPEEERAQFIAEIDVESMSTRELQKAVNDRNQAVKERDQAFQKKADLQKAMDDQVSKITQLTTERDNLKTKAEELRKSQAEIETKAGNLRLELSSIKQSTSYEVVQRMSKNLTAAHIKASANKIAFLYESLDRTFKELTWELSEFAAKDPDTYETYKNKVIDFLARGFKEKM